MHILRMYVGDILIFRANVSNSSVINTVRKHERTTTGALCLLFRSRLHDSKRKNKEVLHNHSYSSEMLRHAVESGSAEHNGIRYEYTRESHS